MKGVLFIILPIALMIWIVPDDLMETTRCKVALFLIIITLIIGLSSLESVVKENEDKGTPIYGFLLICLGLAFTILNWLGLIISMLGLIIFLTHIDKKET